jgi:hypothetical protein
LLSLSSFSQNQEPTIQNKTTNLASKWSIEAVISSVDDKIIKLADGAITLDVSNTSISAHKYTVNKGVIYNDRTSFSSKFLVPNLPIVVTSQLTDKNTGQFLQPESIFFTPINVCTFDGNLQAVDTKARTIKVLGQTVLVTNDTVIMNCQGNCNSTSLENLKTNTYVSILIERKDGTLFAQSIAQKPNNVYGGGGSSISGSILEVTASAIKLLSSSLAFDTSNTKILSLYNTDYKSNLVKLSSLKPNMKVSISFMEKEGSPKPFSVSVIPSDDGRIIGYIEEVDLQNLTLKVAGQRISYTKDTIFLYQGKQTNIESLTIGKKVNISFKSVDKKLFAFNDIVIKDR